MAFAVFTLADYYYRNRSVFGIKLKNVNVDAPSDNMQMKRLDRKSSRGMVFENEELRLRTINISADVERGQSDIRKLRRENELLRREIWTLRDEYDRLDKLLQEHRSLRENNNNLKMDMNYRHSDGSCDDSSENSSDSCGVCTEIENNDEMEESIGSLKKDENSNKSFSEQSTPTSPRHNVSFKLLTPVTEESSSLKYSNSDTSGDHPNSTTPPNTSWMNNKLSLLDSKPGQSIIKPKLCKTNSQPTPSCSSNQQTLNRKLSFQYKKSVMTSTFQKGGNLEDLLSDIENLSRDIYNMQLQNSRVLSKSNETIHHRPDVITNSVSMASLRSPNSTPTSSRKPFRSQVNLVLTQPSSLFENNSISHPPIGFENFISNRCEASTSHQKDDIESQKCLSSPPLTPEEQKSSSALLKLSIDTANLRKQFIKTQSQSMNDELLRQNLTIPPHSKEASQQNGVIEKRQSLETISEIKPPNSADTCITTSNGTDEPESPTKSEKSNRKNSVMPNFFFRRRKQSKKDTSDDFFGSEYMPTTSLMKPTTFRGTTNTKVARKNPAKDLNQSAATRYQKRMGLLDSKGNKKFGRLSVDSNIVEGGEDSGASLLETSSRESSVSFRQRRMSSSPEGKNSGDKIPWCACWGNGCY